LALRVGAATHDIHLGTRFGTPALSWDSVVHRDFDGNIAPGLATSWKFAADNLSVEFDLRKDAKFHNGDPFSAEDVVYSLERMRRPSLRAGYKPNLARIARFEVVDRYKVRATLSEPFPEILGNLEPFFGIVPRQYTERIGDTAFMDKPVGTGPFKFVNLVPGDRLTVEAFTDHYRRVPQFKTLVVRGIPEAVTRVAALKTGEVDAMDIVPPYEVPSLRANPTTDVVAEDVNETDFFLISTLEPNHPFAKKEVRLALNYALNRDALVKDVFYGLARPATTLSAPYESGYDPNLKPYPYDPEKARQLLASAGYPNGVDAGKLNYDPEIGRAHV
jgi:peptide/nickel transport system substrate-binding protein